MSGATYTSLAYETLDLICFKVYGHTETALEIVLEANPDLLQYRGYLPRGTEIFMPEIDASVFEPSTIKLWDYKNRRDDLAA